MSSSFHSVRLKAENCVGCVHCLKSCPTKAIRIKNNRASIIDDRCIDCGECIRVCPQNAKVVDTDEIERINDYKHTIAIVSPAFLVQFPNHITPEKVLHSLVDLGFDSVFDLCLGGEISAKEINKILESGNYEPPLISSHCPAIVRLVQVKFPELVSNLVPVDTPLDITAELAKNYVFQNEGIEKDDIGVFFLTMCSAKVTAIKNPEGKNNSPVDGTISVAEIYHTLRKIVKEDVQKKPNLVIPGSPGLGMGFDIVGCDKTGIKECICLSISGIDKVIKILQEIELKKIPQLEYLELYSCDGGCVAGMLNVQNPYVTQVRFREVMDSLNEYESNYELLKKDLPEGFSPQRISLEARPIGGLSDNISQSLRKLGMMEKTLSDLPGVDCGACGAPTCRDLAEDIVQGRAEISSCVFYLLNSMAELTGEAYYLAKKVPYVRGKNKTKRIDSFGGGSS